MAQADIAGISATRDDVEAGWSALKELGMETPEGRERLAIARQRALRLVGARRTRTGTSRARRLALCGVPMPVRVAGLRWERGGVVVGKPDDGLVTFMPRCCRDRWCPSCQLDAHRRRAEVIAEQAQEAHRAGLRLGFLTLTQRKREEEKAADALDRLLLSWKKLKRSAKFTCVGGVRAVEVVARRAGERVKKTGRPYAHVVSVGGIHAHIHALVAIADAPGAWFEGVSGWWTRRCSDAAYGAQHCVWPNIRTGSEAFRLGGEVGQYLDLCELYEIADRAPEYVGEILDALEGRRLIEGFGAWKGKIGARPEPSLRGITFATASVAGLVRSRLLRKAVRWGRGGDAPADGEKILAEIAAGPKGGVAEVVAALKKSCAEMCGAA